MSDSRFLLKGQNKLKFQEKSNEPLSPLAVQVITWTKDPRKAILVLENTSEDDVQRLEDTLRQRGLKPRCNWFSATQTLELLMPEPIHECISDWIGFVLPFIDAAVKTYNVCDAIKPSLRLAGPTSYVTSSGKFQPDQGINVYNQRTNKWLRNSYPPVVFEVANSQPLKEAKKKAWHWLYHTDYQVQAVVIYDLCHPIPAGKTFTAEISVWVRSSTDIDVEYPLDDCGIKRESSPLSELGSPSNKNSSQDQCSSRDKSFSLDKNLTLEENMSQKENLSLEGRQSPGSSTTETYSREGTTLVDSQHGDEDVFHVDESICEDRLKYHPPHDGREIRCRYDPIMIINEIAQHSHSLEPHNLKFSVFDFVRICRLKAEGDIFDKIIEVDLTRLCEVTRAHVSIARKAQAALANNPTNEGAATAESDSKATPILKRKRPAPDPDHPELKRNRALGPG